MSRPRRHVTLANPTVRDGRQRPRFWTVQRQWRLAEYLERGLTDAEIGRTFGVSAEAVKLARQDFGIRPRTKVHLSTRSVARLLGIGCSKTVARWVDRGFLSSHRTPRGPHGQRCIRYSALIRFLEDPEHHCRWNPERITDPSLREWAREIWTGPFLTPGEVAERCYVGVTAVNNWIHHGHIRAYRHGNWWIREADLDGFVPPHQRSKVGIVPIRFTPDEDALLVELRSQGWSWPRIARRMGRNVGSVHGRWRRLAEREDMAA